VKNALLLFSIVSYAGSAQAYIGPGAGLGAVALVIAVLLGFLMLVVGLVWYPLKRMLKRRKSEEPEAERNPD